MTDEVRAACEHMLALVRNKKYRGNMDTQDMYELGQECVAFRSFILKPCIDAEMAYRKKKAEFLAGESVAKAEALAKATDEYADHVYLQDMKELVHEQALMAKKIVDAKNREWTGM